MSELPRCRFCDGVLPEGAQYCPECGGTTGKTHDQKIMGAMLAFAGIMMMLVAQ